MHAAWGRALLPALSFIALTSLTGPLRAATYGAALTNLCDAVAGGGTPVNLDALCSGGGVIDGIPVDAVSFGSSLTPTDNLSSAIVSSGPCADPWQLFSRSVPHGYGLVWGQEPELSAGHRHPPMLPGLRCP